MLFATEGFESFNAIIRSFSVHSNHQAPSRDIAAGMAHHSRIRHLLSSGLFHVPRIVGGRIDDTSIHDTSAGSPPSASSSSAPRSPWLSKMSGPAILERGAWRSVGPGPLSLLHIANFRDDLLRFNTVATTAATETGTQIVYHT